jgi:hypothetical protein
VSKYVIQNRETGVFVNWVKNQPATFSKNLSGASGFNRFDDVVKISQNLERTGKKFQIIFLSKDGEIIQNKFLSYWNDVWNGDPDNHPVMSTLVMLTCFFGFWMTLCTVMLTALWIGGDPSPLYQITHLLPR